MHYKFRGFFMTTKMNNVLMVCVFFSLGMFCNAAHGMKRQLDIQVVPQKEQKKFKGYRVSSVLLQVVDEASLQQTIEETALQQAAEEAAKKEEYGKKYECDRDGCIFVTWNKGYMQAHTHRHTELECNPKKMVYHCSTCGYLARDKRRYSEHLWTHQ